MALSNWLTRQEWNAAYFLYFLEAAQGNAKYPCDLAMHLRGGICFLAKAGYKDWKGITVGNPNDLGSVHKCETSLYGASACKMEGDNARCLAEIISGTFDPDARLLEFIAWLVRHPEVDMSPYNNTLNKITCLRFGN